MDISRRDFLKLMGGLGAASCTGLLPAAVVGWDSQKMRDLRQKVVVLGFDGVAPGLLEQWAEKGFLPNVKKLMRLGGYRTLGTTNPPESPVAWASFATGCNPGRTGIFGFLKRDPQTYFPMIATAERRRAKFLWKLVPIEAPGATNCRRGKPFWRIASENRIRSVVLQAPVSFEPEPLEGGYILSGLGVPDLRGTQGTYHYFSTGFSNEDVANTEMGGKLVRLQFKGDVASALVQGPWNPLLEQEKDELREELTTVENKIAAESELGRDVGSLRADREELLKAQRELDVREPILAAPIRFRRLGGESIGVDVAGKSIQLRVGQWSEFVEIEFEVTALATARGIARFYLESLSPEVSVYMTPVNLDPRDPILTISQPKSFSKELAERIGLFKTQGWAIDTMAYNEGMMSDEAFLQDAACVFEAREKMLFYSLENLPSNLTFMLFSDTDRVQHVFFRMLDPSHPSHDPNLASRVGNPILDFYKRMDSVIGKVLAKADSDTTVLVLSDHGFHPFRRGVNFNTWLHDNGHLHTRRDNAKQRDLEGLFGGDDFFSDVDFERTKAYSLGLGQIYINLRGRESLGTVQAGAEYQSIKKEIARGLRGLKDPKTGEVAVREVYDRDDVYWGEMFDQAPDLQVGMASGYRVAWQCTLGGRSPEVFEDNKRRWSGDHCSLDCAISPGVLLCNRPIASKSPSIMDIAPTVLSLLGISDVADMDGKVLAIGG